MTNITSIKEIRSLTGLSQRAFCEKYNIPTRTLEAWEAGERKPAPYLLILMEKAVRYDLGAK